MRARLQARLFDTGTPARVGDYVVVRALGEGAMGTVFIAYDPHLDRRVAVKVLRRLRGGDEAQASARMEREARAMARLAHPNVVAVHEVGVDDGQVFVAMEYVEGGTLAQWCREHPVDSRARLLQVLDLAVQAARGLQAAHAAGLVHRDLKPANILVGDDGRLRIADFGLARPQGEGAHPTEEADAADVMPSLVSGSGSASGSQRDDERLTSTGEIVGTPAYMAPEQFGGVSDERSDQFSWCVTFFEAVYGVRPFSGANLHELAEAAKAGAVNKPPANAHVPGWLRRLLERGLLADPAARWPSMEAILAEIARRRGSRGWRIIGGLALVAVGVVGTMAYERARSGEPDGPVCPSAADQLDAAWGPDRRAAIERAFESTEVPYAHDAWVRVERGLGAVAQQWVEAKAQVCHAADTGDPRAREHAALREACLDRGRQAMEFVSDQLALADADAVRFSAHTVAGLHDRIRCDQAALLATPEQGSDDIIDATLVQLERARALRDLHRLSDAQATLEQALAPIPEDGFVRLRAQVYETLVSVALLAEDRDALREHATRLLDYAERSGDPELRASAWVSLSLVARNEQQYDDAAFRVGRAENLAAHAPLSDGMRARVARGRAEIHANQQQHGEALPEFREALEILERRSPDSIEVAYLLRAVADSMFGHGEEGGSVQLLERSLELHQRLLGPDHPDTAMAHIVLANVLVRLRSERTPEHLEQAERILKANPEYRPSALGHVHELKGLDILTRIGGDPEAELRRAEEIFVRTLGPEHSSVFHVRLFRANALQMHGRTEDAAAAYRTLLEAPNPGESQPVTLATARMNLADVEAILGHREFALEQIALAREVFDQAMGGRGPLWRNSMINMARVYRNAGQPKEAARLLEDVVRAAERSPEPVPAHERMWLQVERAWAALALDDRHEALAAARTARGLVAEAEEVHDLAADLAKLEQELGLAAPTEPAPG